MSRFARVCPPRRPDEEYRRKFRSRARADQASGPDDHLPPSGGVAPEEFFARRER